MNDEILNAIVDTPDERDIPYRDLVLVGGSTADKVVFPMDRLIIQNQAAQDITSMACSRYGATHIINGQTLLTEDKQDLQGIDLWKRYLEKNPSAERNGATLLSALDQAKKEGLISAYGTIDTVELAIEAIDKGHFIYTGSNNGDWISVRDKNLYALRTDSQIIGHCWVIVNHKKDEKKLIAINSLGQEN